MATLTLKNLPEDLLDRLRKRASDERRSLNQEVIHLLEQFLLADEKNVRLREDKQRQVEAWRQIAGRWKSSQTAEEEIREIYSARTPGRDVNL